MTKVKTVDFLMVYTGRLRAKRRLKDIKLVLERFGSKARLCLVGKGPEQDKLKEYFEGTNTVFTMPFS